MSAGSILRRLARAAAARAPVRRPRPAAGTGARQRHGGASRAAPEHYPGDFAASVRPVYAPDLDGAPDPGEIVWAWVPFEEDHSRGKDRPVLLVGRDGPWLLALMLTSRDRDALPNHRGETWLDLGVGDWDAQRRPSEVRLDRVLRLDPAAVRREGAILDRDRFARVTRGMAELAGPGGQV